jgi:signal peptidase
MKKLLNGVTYFLCVFFAIILLINTALIVQSMLNEDELPDVFGYFPMVVLSESMVPTVQAGDLVIYQKKSPEDVGVGDIIVFYDPADTSRLTLVTHRIMEVNNDNGETTYRTKGDANNTDDQYPVTTDEMIGIFKARIPKMGNAVLFLQTTKGMLVCIVIPLILLFALDSIGRGRTPKEKTVEPKVENEQ